MTLAEIINLTYTHTNRPDLVAVTTAAVKKATLKLHGKDFFKKDLREVIVTPTPVVAGNFLYMEDLSNAALYPRVKKVSYIREYAQVPNGSELRFDPIDSDNIIDEYRLPKINIFYQIGFALNIRAGRSVAQFTVGYYSYPNVTDAGYSSWIATEVGDYIAEEAAKNILKTIGKDEEYKKYEDMTKDNEAALIAANIG